MCRAAYVRMSAEGTVGTATVVVMEVGRPSMAQGGLEREEHEMGMPGKIAAVAAVEVPAMDCADAVVPADVADLTKPEEIVGVPERSEVRERAEEAKQEAEEAQEEAEEAKGGAEE